MSKAKSETKAVSKTEKLAKAFRSGAALNVKDIKKLGIANPTDAIFRLRKQGYCIYTNKRDNGMTEYRLGTPNRKMVSYLFDTFGSAMYNDDFFA